MSRRNIILWGLAIVAMVSVFLFSAFYIKKYTQKGGPAKPGQQMSVTCNFANDEEVIKKAQEDKDVYTCACVKDEKAKSRCQTGVENTTYYEQARAQFDAKFCAMIKDDQRATDICNVVVSSGIDYMKKQNPEKLADTFLESGNFDAAIEILQGQGLSKVSSMLRLALNLASKAIYDHKEAELVPQALDLVEKAKKLEPNNPEVYRVEGYVYEAKPDLMLAIKSYDKSLKLKPNYLVALTGRAHVYNMMGDMPRALEDFKKAAQFDKDKKDMTIYANLCRLETSRDDMLEEGIKNCKIVLSSSSTGALLAAEANQILAKAYSKQGKQVEALASLEAAKKISPDDPNMLVAFAETYIEQKDYVQAKWSAEKALEIDPMKTVAFEVLSRIFFLEKNYPQAIEKALKGLEVIDQDVSLLTPSKPVYRQHLNYDLANVYAAQGDKEKEQQYVQAGDDAVKVDEKPQGGEQQ